MLEALLSDTHRAVGAADRRQLHARPPAEGVEPLNAQQFLLEWYSKNAALQE